MVSDFKLVHFKAIAISRGWVEFISKLFDKKFGVDQRLANVQCTNCGTFTLSILQK